MAGTQYLYADNKKWTQHPILTGPCMIQVQYGDVALVHFGALPDQAHPEVYEGVMHQHIMAPNNFWYHGTEEVWVRAFAANVSGINQRVKVVCSRLSD